MTAFTFVNTAKAFSSLPDCGGLRRTFSNIRHLRLQRISVSGIAAFIRRNSSYSFRYLCVCRQLMDSHSFATAYLAVQTDRQRNRFFCVNAVKKLTACALPSQTFCLNAALRRCLRCRNFGSFAPYRRPKCCFRISYFAYPSGRS